MGKIVVGCWDCAYCGADRISGEIQVCPNCGKPRGQDVTFYMAGPKMYVDDPDKVSRKPDWLCSFCDTLNPDENKFCSSCGASREDSEMNYFEMKKKQEEEARRREEEERRKAQKEGTAENRSRSGRPILLAAIVAAIILLVILSMPRQRGMHVDAKTWERSIAIERLQAVQDSAWTLPDGAWDVTSREEIYRYDQVLDHYETRSRQVAEQVFDGYDISYTYTDLGNGHFEEVEHETPRYRTEYHTEYYEVPIYVNVPVYETKYYFTINKWLLDREEKTRGRDNEPFYAELTLSDTERESGRGGQYWIVSGDKTYETPYEIWEKIVTGSDIKVKIQSGRIVELD